MQQKNKVYFVAVILKVLLVNPLAALNFANVLKIKKRLENKKTLKNQRKNVTKIKKRKKKRFYIHVSVHVTWRGNSLVNLSGNVIAGLTAGRRLEASSSHLILANASTLSCSVRNGQNISTNSRPRAYMSTLLS